MIRGISQGLAADQIQASGVTRVQRLGLDCPLVSVCMRKRTLYLRPVGSASVKDPSCIVTRRVPVPASRSESNEFTDAHA